MIKRLLLSHSYLFAMVVAVLVGILVPQIHVLAKWNTLILQIIFFMSCLRIDLKSVISYAEDWRFLLLANALMLIIFPIIVWAVNLLWPSELMFALFLLAAMPIGMTAALLVELAGGKASITMVLTVTTSLLAPFTIPLLTKLLYGATVSVNAFDIFKQLAFVIFLPFLLAVAVRTGWPKQIEKIKDRTKPISIALLALLIASTVGKQAGPTLALADNLLYIVVVFAVLYVFFFAMNVIGYFAFWWEPHEIKQSASISLACMNFTLAIYLASQFFPEPGIVLPLVFAIVPWVTFMPVWKKMSEKWH